MALELIECVDKGGTFDLKVIADGVEKETKAISDPAFHVNCLEAQISDLLAGMDSNPETKEEVVALITNYEEAISVLKSK